MHRTGTITLSIREMKEHKESSARSIQLKLSHGILFAATKHCNYTIIRIHVYFYYNVL